MVKPMTSKGVALGFFILPVMLGIVVGCSEVSGPGNAPSSAKSEPIVTAREMRDFVNDEKQPLILDVRTEFEYEGGYIEGAVRIPVQDFAAGAYEQKLGDIPKDHPIILYCHSGGRSNFARDVMLRDGFTNVLDFRGGIVEWREAGYPVITNEPKVRL